jgi:hypothetical protein
MKALSIWQPWAWAIIHAGKDVENRGWHTGHRGPLLIHASKRKPTARELRIFSDMIFERFDHGPNRAAELVIAACNGSGQRGGIIGQVDVVDCVYDHPSPWAADDAWNWVLANPQPLPFRPLRGMQRLFEA